MPRSAAPNGAPVEGNIPTIRTVARRAGVGVGTVSRFLNGGSVSQRAKERVGQAIEELSFRPSVAARDLAMRRASTVGLVVGSTRGSWFSELIAGVERALSPSRRSLVIASLRLTGEYDARVVSSWIEDRRVDGILFARCSKLELPLLTAAHAAKLPIALIVPDVAAKADVVVRCENARGGTLLGAHLIERGHRKIAFFGGPRSSRGTKDRLRGLQHAMSQSKRASLVSSVFGNSDYAESGAEFARTFLATPKVKRPTAAVFGSDALALGFAKAVFEAGVRIPEDVAIAGFDGSTEAGLFWPGLTTVEQPTRVMAEAACRALVSRIEGTIFDANQRYDVRLIERNSSASPGKLRS